MALNNLKGLSDLAKTAKRKKGKEVLTVPVDDVVSKVQVRKRFRNIEELAATLLTEGQQSPIIVFPKNEAGKFVIQKGERRWRACKLAGIKTIDLFVNDKVQSKLDETAGELIENIHRDGLTPVEIAEALKKFVEEGWKQKDIAHRLGKNITFVSTHLSLLKMPDCVRELYDAEVCFDTETLNNLRLLFKLNEERSRAVCALAMSEGITRNQSRDILNNVKRIKEEMENSPQFCLGTEAEPSVRNLDLYIEEEKPKELSEQNTLSPKDERGDGILSLSKDKDWKNVRADNLVFSVRVKLDGETKMGIIMTDRVALITSRVWVKTIDSEGKEKHVHVPVSDIELLSVEG